MQRLLKRTFGFLHSGCRRRARHCDDYEDQASSFAALETRDIFSCYSHSIVLVHDNTLIWLRKPFLRTSKHRIHDPSEIRALEFKGKFRRFGICSVSTTIGSNRSIFACSPPIRPHPRFLKRPSQAVRREKDIEPCQRSYRTAAVIGHISDMRRSYAASLCLCIGLQLASSLIILCAPRVREPVGVIERG
jgi:hypothetical protein